MSETQTDALIIHRSLTDPEAFAAIFDRHYDSISGYLARRLERGPAEEVAAETFVVAFERRRAFDSDYASARPWLFGIATNLLGRHRRDERRRMAAYERSSAGLAPGAELTEEVSARVDASMMGREVAQAIAALEPGDRDALLLHAIAELTYSEIGRALGVPIGTVRSRLHRARKQLTDALSPQGVSTRG